jgi:hypothetical protein
MKKRVFAYQLTALKLPSISAAISTDGAVEGSNLLY